MVKTLEPNFEKLLDKKIAVAVSGGRDSMALLHLFSKSSINFFAVNIEHGIRGEDSKSDSAFVAKYCTEQGICLKTFTVDAPLYATQNRMTLEQAAREVRYQVFGTLLRDKECDLVALAHHLDDQAETVLMRIFRGTGLRGLSGMAQSRKGYIRPILNCTREEIDDYIKSNNIPYVDDATNDEADANRNFFRLEIFPLIEKRYPAYRGALSRLARNALETDEFVLTQARLPKPAFRNAVRIDAPFPHNAVFKKEIMLCANALGVFQDIEECHYSALLELQNAQTAKQISLAHGLLAIKEPDSILIAKDSDVEKLEIEFNPQKLPLIVSGNLFRYTFEVSNSSDSSNGTIVFDGDKIPNTCVLRYRKDGDRFTKFGGGTKSLGDFFTDKKIPFFLRDKILVCADNNDILFVAGVEISDKIKISDKTKNIVKLTQEKL